MSPIGIFYIFSLIRIFVFLSGVRDEGRGGAFFTVRGEGGQFLILKGVRGGGHFSKKVVFCPITALKSDFHDGYNQKPYIQYITHHYIPFTVEKFTFSRILKKITRKEGYFL